ncbi:MAG: hypothetical protein ABL977_05665, partial [Candidatus Eisenbacteria bacterium]
MDHRENHIRIIVCVLILLMSPGPAAAAWHQDHFYVGGAAVGLGVGALGSPESRSADSLRLRRLNDAGLDLIIPTDRPGEADGIQLIQLMDAMRQPVNSTFRMKMILNRTILHRPDAPVPEPPPGNTIGFNRDPRGNEVQIRQVLSPSGGLNTDSVEGWYYWDEAPQYPYFKTLDDGHVVVDHQTLPPGEAEGLMHAMTAMLRNPPPPNGSDLSEKLTFNNLLGMTPAAGPLYGPGCPPNTALSPDAYRCYLDRVLSPYNNDPLPAPVLAYDNYIFEGDASEAAANRQHFLRNLAAVRDKSMEYSRPSYRIPFWSFIQLSRRRRNIDFPPDAGPSFEQVRFQAFAALAFGAKGIFYWGVAPMLADTNDHHTPDYPEGILNAQGAISEPLYTAVTSLNSELHALGPTLMKLDCIAAHLTSNPGGMLLPENDPLLSDSHRVYDVVTEATAASGAPALVAYLKDHYNGDDYLFVVNANTAPGGATSFTVRLGSGASHIYRTDGITGQQVLLSGAVAAGGTFSTPSIPPGGGVLLRLEDEYEEHIPRVNKLMTQGGRIYLALPGFVWLDSSMPRDPRRVEIEPAAVEVDRLA